jgi:hypothetical protein
MSFYLAASTDAVEVEDPDKLDDRELTVTTIGVRIGVRTRGLMKGLIGRTYDCSLYSRATYDRQQHRPPHNRPSVIFMML